MKNVKRLLSAIMLFCLIISMLPPVQLVSAETPVTYELDTDGVIDEGDTYLILRRISSFIGKYLISFDGSKSGGFTYSQLIKESHINGNTIAYFDGLEALEWTVEAYAGDAVNAYSLVHKGETGNRYLNLKDRTTTASAEPTPLQFIANASESGKYSVAYKMSDSLFYYLYLTQNNVSFQEATSENGITKDLMFFKKTGGEAPKQDFQLTFHANAGEHTVENLPAPVTVTEGETYTIPATDAALSYTDGANVYTFRYWTENAEGTGNKYAPGDAVTVTKNLELYAQWEAKKLHTVSFDGNGNTSGSVPEDVKVQDGTAYTLPEPVGDFRLDIAGYTYVFKCWMDNLAGDGKEYMPGDQIVVTQDTTLYAHWKLQEEYSVRVYTKLNGSNADLDEILKKVVDLEIRPEGSDSGILMSWVAEGSYLAKVTEPGTYTVWIKHADGTREETDYKVNLENLSASVEIPYYSVSFLVGSGYFRVDNYLAGSTVKVPQEVPEDPDNEFLGWEDQEGHLYSFDDVITESLQDHMVLSAKWKTMGGKSYIVHFLERDTYKKIHNDLTVTGVAVGQKILAKNVARELIGYSYAGAEIAGKYYDKAENPSMEISVDDTENVISIFYSPDPDLHLHKEATLEDDGTYTIEMDLFTHNNPVTTLVEQNIPLDIVLVLDQSGSMFEGELYKKLQDSVTLFINQVANHSRTHAVDHRMAIVGYGTDDETGAAGDEKNPIAGNYIDGQTNTDNTMEGSWTNTGLFDAHGDFHAYPITGFTYTEYKGDLTLDNIKNNAYYTYSDGEYVVLDYLSVYRHMITEQEAYQEYLEGTEIYGYVGGDFLLLRRNDSGLWIYNGNQLYSREEFFTRHEHVLTHRHGIEGRKIHAYLVDGKFVSVGGHEGIYTREETTGTPDKSIYKDALIPVTMGAKGSGYVDNAFTIAVSKIGAAGMTYVSYGMEMANSIFAANPLTEADEESGRKRIVVVFTDGKPGDSTTFDEQETNNALKQAAIAKASLENNGHNAQIFTIGLYGSDMDNTNAERNKKDQEDFLKGMSSDYPEATKLEDVWATVKYVEPLSGVRLDQGGYYYVYVDGAYRQLTHSSLYENRKYYNQWGYKDDDDNRVLVAVLENKLNIAESHPIIIDGAFTGTVNGVTKTYQVYRKAGEGYKHTEASKYYFSAENASELDTYFASVVRALTTQISKEVLMKNDSILRDIMGQGLVLTPGSVITVYAQAGIFDPVKKAVNWADTRKQLAQVTIPENPNATITSQETMIVDGKTVPYISVYNLQSANPTDPGAADYHPHTVDITGYQYDKWFMNAGKLEGYRLVATITRVEATEDVEWGKTTTTNHAQSGLWLRMDENGERHLLETFDQPTTVFVERAYVLDYGKEFQLGAWYFDSEGDKKAEAIHVDCEIGNGMNWFDKSNPTTANGQNRGNTMYGNLRIEEDGKMYYQPTTMQWGGYDQFYVFGNTWRNTVVSQDANQNGNLWNKVTVIPANNIYYEDSFITGDTDGKNGITGFTYNGVWEVLKSDPAAGNNTEHPEHMEGDGKEVHGWTDALADDSGFTDGSGHVAGLPNPDDPDAEPTDASVTFSFTGTGVDVYTRTNARSGILVAQLQGSSNEGKPVFKMFMVDNLSVSGEYYQIPTMSFKDLDYGTYTVTLIATKASAAATGSARYEYCLDGIRVYNPLGEDLSGADHTVKDAYGKELNPIFTEIRDIIIDSYNDFTPGTGARGAAFIDWIREGQGSGDDEEGVGKHTYEVSTTFKTYGPKNEVYLDKGQAVVIKVDPNNTYYMGMKSLTAGKAATVNVSGLDNTDMPQVLTVTHTADLYYPVRPVDGYIVIQNSTESGALLALTKLRTTNMNAKPENNGVLPVEKMEAEATMLTFERRLEEAKNEPAPNPEEPEATLPDPTDKLLELNKKLSEKLFTAVRTWLKKEEGGAA